MASLAQERDRSLDGRLGSFDRRTSRRKVIRLDGFVFSSPRHPSSVNAIDISANGCRLRDPRGEYATGDWLTFSLNGEIVVEGVVRWWNDHQCGVEFLAPLPEQLLLSVS